MNQRRTLAALLLASLATPALAHTGVGATAGLYHGLAHPLGGLDHLLAMLAVGLWAAQQGGRALWAVPGAFVGMLLVGGLLALAGIPLPLVEPGIVGSVILFGVLIASATRLPTAAGMAIVGVFALFHGHAHGSELPESVSALTYAIGFVVATATLHAVGAGAALLGQRWLAPKLLRLGGGVIAAAGVALASGLVS
ncbi:MAG TPA: HupE/UreJ family protein [Candidatus Competibacteraceae bacterium]|nr:HupE/UreJ family protein [Candidatus Competibacteraceae bacterium]